MKAHLKRTVSRELKKQNPGFGMIYYVHFTLCKITNNDTELEKRKTDMSQEQRSSFKESKSPKTSARSQVEAVAFLSDGDDIFVKEKFFKGEESLI